MQNPTIQSELRRAVMKELLRMMVSKTRSQALLEVMEEEAATLAAARSRKESRTRRGSGA